MLIYDGLHYDALALEMFPGAPKDFDVTIFPVDGSGGMGHVTQLAGDCGRFSALFRCSSRSCIFSDLTLRAFCEAVVLVHSITFARQKIRPAVLPSLCFDYANGL